MGEEGETSPSSSGAITGTGFNLLPFKKKKKLENWTKFMKQRFPDPEQTMQYSDSQKKGTHKASPAHCAGSPGRQRREVMTGS